MPFLFDLFVVFFCDCGVMWYGAVWCCMLADLSAHRCTLTARNGEKNLGWTPRYEAEHILEAADDEVALILETLEKKQSRLPI